MDDYFVKIIIIMPQIPINKSFIFNFKEVSHGPSQVHS